LSIFLREVNPSPPLLHRYSPPENQLRRDSRYSSCGVSHCAPAITDLYRTCLEFIGQSSGHLSPIIGPAQLPLPFFPAAWIAMAREVFPLFACLGHRRPLFAFPPQTLIFFRSSAGGVGAVSDPCKNARLSTPGLARFQSFLPFYTFFPFSRKNCPVVFDESAFKFVFFFLFALRSGT